VRRRRPRLGGSAVAAGVFALAAMSTARVGRAQRPDPCFTAPVEGQELQKQGKLLEARSRFAVCAHDTCPREIVQDCTRWSREVDEAVPSIVVAAHDRQGRDLLDVRVSIDGGHPIDLSARAIPMDPGTHRLVFLRDGEANVEQSVLLRDGERNREVAVTFGTPVVPVAPVPPPREATEATTHRPVPTSAWILGGLGIASLASFATFAAIGLSQRASDGCIVTPGCTQSQSDSVNLKFHFADASLGVGVVTLGIATWIYVTRPRVDVRGRGFRLAPAGGVLLF
jgi:hypothetical protein